LKLILCALRDAAAETEPHLVDRFDKLYLINEFQQGPSRFRLQPTEEDRKAYQARVERSGQADAQDLITDAYRFYAQRLREPRPGGNPIDATAFERVIAERMAIVEITTEHGDNAHRIFQSINGTGVDLNQADLLRNYIFMLLPTEAEMVYEQVWRPMEMTVGVDNLAGLARVDLQRRGQNVATSDVYAVHQRLLDPMAHDEGKVRAWAEDFAMRGRHYKRLIDPASEPDAELAAGLGRLARWGAQTSYPVLMVAYDLHEREIIDSAELRRVVAIIDGEGFADDLHRELSRERLDNNPFERKLEIYGESHLELNQALQENKSWGRDEILARAETLATQICEMWMSPLPDIKDASARFDWTRIEAAIAAVPLGRWTAYSDLAELGGTAAQAVGNFVANMYHGTGAYRVLTADGKISPLFHWDDPNEVRDVRELLVAEAIQFDDDQADPAQRMTSDELANLVDVGDEDELLLDASAY
jgi:alkylated DNA nucleotide flippase Atl1